MASAHPRVCGENNPVARHAEGRPGSSPRVRGKHSKPLRNVKCGRLIPACAGKTSSNGVGSCLARAHPRVCGENTEVDISATSAAGSSPRVRGKRAARPGVQVGDRLIPACAGKTSPGRQRGSRTAAHPRVCGENTTAVAARPRACGSSPRVRGKPRGGVRGVRGRGLIPACAGKTCEAAIRCACNGAHPRVCGENPDKQRHSAGQTGSSPRVRGKLTRAGSSWVLWRVGYAVAGAAAVVVVWLRW